MILYSSDKVIKYFEKKEANKYKTAFVKILLEKADDSKIVDYFAAPNTKQHYSNYNHYNNDRTMLNITFNIIPLLDNKDIILKKLSNDNQYYYLATNLVIYHNNTMKIWYKICEYKNDYQSIFKYDVVVLSDFTETHYYNLVNNMYDKGLLYKDIILNMNIKKEDIINLVDQSNTIDHNTRIILIKNKINDFFDFNQYSRLNINNLKDFLYDLNSLDVNLETASAIDQIRCFLNKSY